MANALTQSQGLKSLVEPQLEALEDRVTRRMADSVESLGDIIKEYADIYEHLISRVKNIESYNKVPQKSTSKTSNKIV